MEDAAARKARLKRLREEADATEAAVPAAVEEPKLKFRNYAPRDEKIEHEVVAQPEVKDFEALQIEPEQPGDEGVRRYVATCCMNSCHCGHDASIKRRQMWDLGLASLPCVRAMFILRRRRWCTVDPQHVPVCRSCW